MTDSGSLASPEQLRLLAETAPIGMFMTDAENRFTYTNPRWSEITGLIPEDVLGRLRSDIISAQFRSGHISELPHGSIDDSEMSYRVELRVQGLPSRIVHVTSKSIQGSDGVPRGWVGTVADVTAEALAQTAMSESRDKATEMSRLKSEFLANISHEIRTPMNGVIGMTELLLDADLDPRQYEFAQALRDSGQALLWIVDEILDFSRIEAGNISVESADFDVRNVIDEAVMLVVASAQKKGIDLVVSVSRSVPAIVAGDARRLRQVLTNLVGNAIKFSQVGEVVVRVTAFTKDGEATIRYEVEDTGDGISPDKLAVIFQPFMQADASTSRKYQGAGLGLSISRELVRLMGGDCEVSSEPGVGSTFAFTIRVPVVEEISHAAIQALDLEAIPSAREGAIPRHRRENGVALSARILLVEDNVINQKVACAMLTGAGYEVETVSDGHDAVRLVQRSQFDAILMDCQMPGMDGYEATAAIRALEGSSRRTPIIAVTAGARSEDRDRCLAEGMDGYLAKPLTRESLLSSVARSLGI